VRTLRAPAHRGATIVIGLLLFFLAFTLLFIGASSPYTHANLAPGYDDGYDRTEQIVVGSVGQLRRVTTRASDPAERGAELYVAAGCVGCHALEGRGGVIGKAIAGVDQALLEQRVRGGTSGMPRFSTEALTDAQVAEIGAYLRSLTALAWPSAAPATPPPATPAASPPPASPTPQTSAAASPATSPASDLLAQGKNVYETAGEVGCTGCHGPSGKGGITKTGDSAPDIRGATEQKLRAALGGGAAVMTYISLTDDEIEAVIAYLKYLNEQ